MGMPPFVSVITLPHCQKVTMSPGSSWIAVASYLQHIRSYNSSQAFTSIDSGLWPTSMIVFWQMGKIPQPWKYLPDIMVLFTLFFLFPEPNLSSSFFLSWRLLSTLSLLLLTLSLFNEEIFIFIGMLAVLLTYFVKRATYFTPLAQILLRHCLGRVIIGQHPLLWLYLGALLRVFF